MILDIVNLFAIRTLQYSPRTLTHRMISTCVGFVMHISSTHLFNNLKREEKTWPVA